MDRTYSKLFLVWDKTCSFTLRTDWKELLSSIYNLGPRGKKNVFSHTVFSLHVIATPAVEMKLEPRGASGVETIPCVLFRD